LNKELKQQIKQDELVSSLQHGWKWLQANRELARTVGLVVVGAAFIVGGVTWFQGHRTQASNAALDEALAVYARPLAAEAAGTPNLATFPTAKDKYTAAAAAFDGVERRYPTLSAGVRARYYGALCRIELGDYDTARKTLQSIADRGAAGSLEPTLARLALADVDRRTGSYDKAIAAYKQLAGDPASPLPRESTLMSLASTLEDAKRSGEAAASYREIVEQFPGSVYAAEARRRAAYLGGTQS
jgi:tetratricopeptide (TPR) repeat protein